MKTYHAISIGSGVVLATPSADGTVGQIIQTDGNGVLSFVDQDGGGEANTGSNVGTLGVGVFDAKVGVDLQFRNVNAATGIAVALDANQNIDVGLANAVGESLKGNAGIVPAAPQDLQKADFTDHANVVAGDVVVGYTAAGLLRSMDVDNLPFRTVRAETIVGNTSVTPDVAQDLQSADITTGTPVATDFLVGFKASGLLRKFDVGDLPGGGGTPGGSDTQLQFNNAGAFGGAAALTYMGTELFVTSQAATDVPIAIIGALGQTANLTEWQQSDTTVGARITAAAEFSNPLNPSGFTNTQQFGENVTISGNAGTAYGNDTKAGNSSCAYGQLSEADIGTRGTAYGYATHAKGVESSAVGYFARSNTGSHSFALGAWAATTAANQLMIGGTNGEIDLIECVGTSGSNHYRPAVLLQDMTNDPVPTATQAGVFAKNVTATVECFAINSAGTATQLTSHDEDGYWFHHSQIPQRKTTLKIHIEKALRHLAEHHPELELAQFIEES